MFLATLILCITKLLGQILRTVLALYMDDEDLPLPTLEEVLICDSTTTAEEVFYDVDGISWRGGRYWEWC